MGWLLDVRQTTDMGVLIRKFRTWVPTGYPGTGEAMAFDATTWTRLREALTGGNDPLSDKTHFLTANASMWAGYGVPTVALQDLVVGTRFYVSGNHYIRVSALSYSNPSSASITLDYYKGNVLCWSVSRSSWNANDRPVLFMPWISDFRSISFGYVRETGLSKSTSGGINYIGYPSGIVGASNSDITNFNTWLEGVEPVDDKDPYIDIPDSEPSGPAEGSGIPESDPIPAPSLPTVSVTDTGFVGLFNPTLTQVQALADYMWTGLFDINTFKKIFADPMDCILGFNMVPVNVPSGSPAAVRVGNISTGVQMNVATAQWVEVDCGSVTVDLPYGCYLDYAPYSKFSLYLPYIGTVELSTDDVVGRTLSLKYHVDILSCSCVAYLTCGTQTLYQFTGSCGYSIPLTGDNFRQMISNIIGIAATVAGAVATGGAAAPAAAGAMTAKQAARAAAKAAAAKQARTVAAIGASESVAQNVMGAKPEVHRSGAIGSSAGIMGIQTPFLIMELPNACKPEKQYHYLGYPGFITTTIGSISGYAEFESVILDGIACTEDERGIIESYCAGGIYV